MPAVALSLRSDELDCLTEPSTGAIEYDRSSLSSQTPDLMSPSFAPLAEHAATSGRGFRPTFRHTLKMYDKSWRSPVIDSPVSRHEHARCYCRRDLLSFSHYRTRLHAPNREIRRPPPQPPHCISGTPSAVAISRGADGRFDNMLSP